METQQEVKNLAARKSTGESGGIQAPEPSRGLGARAPRAWGPAWGLFPQKPQITIFSQTSWWEPGEGVGVG